MKIRRSRLTSDFVQLPNSTVRDARLSYMARGILAELLSRPDDWEATADELWRQASGARGAASEGRRAFRAAFAELKTHGYIVASREQLPGGRHGTVLTVYDLPKTDVPHGGMSVRPAEIGVVADQAEVPHGGTSGVEADVPGAGTSVPPGETGIPAGRTDVPPSDVPHGGTSSRKRSTNTENTSPRARAERLMRQWGATEDETTKILSKIEASGNIRSLPAYLRRMELQGDLARMLADERKIANGREAAARQSVAMAGGEHAFEDDGCGTGTCRCERPRRHRVHGGAR